MSERVHSCSGERGWTATLGDRDGLRGGTVSKLFVHTHGIQGVIGFQCDDGVFSSKKSYLL
jgi:hypothetical protein